MTPHEHHYQLRRLIDNSPKEINGIPLTLKPSLYDPTDLRNHLLFATPDTSILPRETFNREKLPFRHPKPDQKNLGICYGMSSCTGYLAKNAQDQGILPPEGFSSRFFCSVIKNKDGNPHEMGSDLRTTLNVAQTVGTVPDSLYPTAQMTQDHDLAMPPQNLIDQAAKYRTSGSSLVLSPSDPDRSILIPHVMAAIAAGNILEIGVLVCQNFMDVIGPDYVIPLPQGKILGGHALKLIDYRTMPDDTHQFLTWNQWGGAWANDDEAWFPESWLTNNTDITGNGSKCYYMSEIWQALDKVPPKLPTKTIALKKDNPIAIVNGKDVQIDPADPGVVPTIIKNRLFLPLRFVAENLGVQVDWEQGEEEAVIEI